MIVKTVAMNRPADKRCLINVEQEHLHCKGLKKNLVTTHVVVYRKWTERTEAVASAVDTTTEYLLSLYAVSEKLATCSLKNS